MVAPEICLVPLLEVDQLVVMVYRSKGGLAPVLMELVVGSVVVKKTGFRLVGSWVDHHALARVLRS